MNTSNTGFYCLNGDMQLFEPKEFKAKPEDQMDVPFTIDLEDIF
jgi:hypothetical protein